MRIEKTRNQTPESAAFSDPADQATSDDEARFVWEVLAPRLLQPSKLAFIQALLGNRRPMTLSQLAEAAEIAKDHAQHQCRSMREAGVLEPVSAPSPDEEDDEDEPSYYFPKPPEAIPSPPAKTR